jgi:hypothetical protein
MVPEKEGNHSIFPLACRADMRRAEAAQLDVDGVIAAIAAALLAISPFPPQLVMESRRRQPDPTKRPSWRGSAA